MRRGVTASASHEATIEHAGRYLPESLFAATWPPITLPAFRSLTIAVSNTAQTIIQSIPGVAVAWRASSPGYLGIGHQAAPILRAQAPAPSLMGTFPGRGPGVTGTAADRVRDA